MPLVLKPALDLVIDAINEANPDLPVEASVDNVKLGVPASQTPPSGTVNNTKLTVSPAGDGTYIGRKEIQYRRTDMSVWFRGMTVRIDAWHPNKASQAGPNRTTTFSIYELLPRINKKYGLYLTVDDLVDQRPQIEWNVTDPNGNFYWTTVVATKPGSLGYVGSFTLEWHDAARSLAEAIAVNDLPNTRMFPGGNDFSGAHKEIVNFMGFGVDWTNWAATNPWPGYPTVGNVSPTAWNTWLTKFFNEINRIYGTSLSGVSGTDVPYPVGVAASPRVITLPDAAYPELNSRFYNRCLLVPIMAGSVSMVGTFALHFNV